MVGYGNDYGQSYGTSTSSATITAPLAGASATALAAGVTSRITATAIAPLAGASTAALAAGVTSRITATVAPSTTTASTAALAAGVTSRITARPSPAPAHATATAPQPTIASNQPATVTTPLATESATALGVVVASRNPVTVSSPATTVSTTTAAAGVSGQQQPVVNPAPSGATATAPTPALSNPALVTPTLAGAQTHSPTPATISRITATVTSSVCGEVTNGTAPSVTVTRHPVISPGVAGATETAPVSSTYINKDMRIWPLPASGTAGAKTPYLNPTHAAVAVPASSATETAPLATPVERNRVVLYAPEAHGHGRAQPPRVEAIAPIEALPAALEGKSVTARTVTRVAPEIDIEPEVPDLEPPEPEVEPPTSPTMADPAERVQSSDDSVYTPARQVVIDDREFNVERDIRVSATEYGFAVAEVTLYNIGAETWAHIDREDTIEVSLGWEGSGLQQVFDGHVVTKRRRHRRGNRGYVLRARSNDAAAVTQRVTQSFTDLSPHRIVDYLAGEVEGVSAGYIAPETEPLEGSYSLTGAKELADWLDRLAAKAQNQTGERWVWYVEKGRLYFHPAKAQATDHVAFSMDKSVQQVTPTGLVEGPRTQQEYEVLMRCEPIVRRGLATSIEGADSISETRAFRVSSYVHESRTTTGRHHTTASLAPMFREVDDL